MWRCQTSWTHWRLVRGPVALSLGWPRRAKIRKSAPPHGPCGPKKNFPFIHFTMQVLNLQEQMRFKLFTLCAVLTTTTPRDTTTTVETRAQNTTTPEATTTFETTTTAEPTTTLITTTPVVTTTFEASTIPSVDVQVHCCCRCCYDVLVTSSSSCRVCEDDSVSDAVRCASRLPPTPAPFVRPTEPNFEPPSQLEGSRFTERLALSEEFLAKEQMRTSWRKSR